MALYDDSQKTWSLRSSADPISGLRDLHKCISDTVVTWLETTEVARQLLRQLPLAVFVYSISQAGPQLQSYNVSLSLVFQSFLAPRGLSSF